jgi:3-Oxoacyl-[acyl-carrier-protein (ACP)] synthase III
MRVNTIGICAASAFLPGDPVDVLAWASKQGVGSELVAELLSNKCRYFHEGSTESDVELIEAALDRLEGPIGWQYRVGYIVHAHTQAFSMPAPPESILADLCRRRGFKPVLAFSVSSLACASLISALDSAVRCLNADPKVDYALVVTSDRVFGGARFRIRGAACIQSDGASAILLGRTNLRCQLGSMNFVNFTPLHEGPSTPAGAARMTHFLGRHTVALLRLHEEITGQPIRSIDEILPTNADYPAWREVIQELHLDETKVFFENIAAHGHACCSDFAVNLVDHGFARLDKGHHLLAAGTSNIGAFAALSLHPNTWNI